MVRKRGKCWCVLHGHAQKKGSKRDKPKGSVIKCFCGSGAQKKAQKMHTAIILSQRRRGG